MPVPHTRNQIHPTLSHIDLKLQKWKMLNINSIAFMEAATNISIESPQKKKKNKKKCPMATHTVHTTLITFSILFCMTQNKSDQRNKMKKRTNWNRILNLLYIEANNLTNECIETLCHSLSFFHPSCASNTSNAASIFIFNIFRFRFFFYYCLMLVCTSSTVHTQWWAKQYFAILHWKATALKNKEWTIFCSD